MFSTPRREERTKPLKSGTADGLGRTPKDREAAALAADGRTNMRENLEDPRCEARKIDQVSFTESLRARAARFSTDPGSTRKSESDNLNQLHRTE
jgi:hypothetical protein